MKKPHARGYGQRDLRKPPSHPASGSGEEVASAAPPVNGAPWGAYGERLFRHGAGRSSTITGKTLPREGDGKGQTRGYRHSHPSRRRKRLDMTEPTVPGCDPYTRSPSLALDLDEPSIELLAHDVETGGLASETYPAWNVWGGRTAVFKVGEVLDATARISSAAFCRQCAY